MNLLKSKKKEIGILGAGISGMVAGIILAKNNYKVKIFERRSRIGSYFVKDIHSLRNYSYGDDILKKYEELGIKISNTHPIFREFRFSPSLKCVEIYSKDKPLFYNLVRGYKNNNSLDNELFKKAKDYGVQFYFNQAISFTSKSIDIVATGNSCVKGIAYGGHYKKVHGAKLDSVYYFLNDYYAPGGYIYILPFLNEFSLIIATTKIKEKKQLKKRLDAFRKNNDIVKKILKNAKFKNEVFGTAFFDIPKTAIKNKKLYVGEATGFLDAATGFGVHYAILSGYLAAMAIINNENYDRLWNRNFKNELEAKYLKRLYLEKLRNEDYEKIIGDLLKNCGKKILIEKYKTYKYF